MSGILEHPYWSGRLMKSCVICKQDVPHFLPYKNGSEGILPLVTDLRIIGSDVENFYCPHCGCFDRERHLFIYFSLVPEMAEKIKGGRVLHIAPEKHVSLLVQQLQPLEYIRGDINPRDPSFQKVNLEETGFPDESFDFVIANHVLEHVYDDTKAINEIHRILKKGGLALLQTPYSSVLESTIAEVTPHSEATRLMLFGETDHMRLYGLDIFSRITAPGLSFVGGNHATFNIDIDSRECGINEAEPLFLFKKTETHNPNKIMHLESLFGR
jgi:SAM-dependent methyltransferase